MRPAVGDCGQAIVGRVKLPEADGVPEFLLTIDFDAGEIAIGAFQLRKTAKRPGCAVMVC